MRLLLSLQRASTDREQEGVEPIAFLQDLVYISMCHIRVRRMQGPPSKNCHLACGPQVVGSNVFAAQHQQHQLEM